MSMHILLVYIALSQTYVSFNMMQLCPFTSYKSVIKPFMEIKQYLKQFIIIYNW